MVQQNSKEICKVDLKKLDRAEMMLRWPFFVVAFIGGYISTSLDQMKLILLGFVITLIVGIVANILYHKSSSK